MSDVAQAAAYVRARCVAVPRIACVTGSGMGAVVNCLTARARLAPGETPGLPLPKVAGHGGEIVCGSLKQPEASNEDAGREDSAGGNPPSVSEILLVCGRRHLYEGCGEDESTFSVRLIAALGCEVLVLLNAVGGLRLDLAKGDLVIASGYIAAGAWGGAFRHIVPRNHGARPLPPVCDAALRRMVYQTAEARGLTMREGVYGWVTGPNYETPAEIHLLRELGADVVGMSGAPEAAAARQSGLRTICASLVTNVCSEIPRNATTHEEVLATAQAGHDTLHRFLHAFVEASSEILDRPD